MRRWVVKTVRTKWIKGVNVITLRRLYLFVLIWLVGGRRSLSPGSHGGGPHGVLQRQQGVRRSGRLVGVTCRRISLAHWSCLIWVSTGLMVRVPGSIGRIGRIWHFLPHGTPGRVMSSWWVSGILVSRRIATGGRWVVRSVV